MEADPTLARLHAARQETVERLGRIASELVSWHRAQDYTIQVLLDINQEIRDYEAGIGAQ